MRPLLFALLAASALPAAVVLNAPDPHSGFYDGNSDYFSFDGTGLINGLSSSQLPEANGLSAQKVWGSATFGIVNDNTPYIVLIAEGSASGIFDVDTRVAVQFHFNVPDNDIEIPFYVQGELFTSDGGYYTEYGLFNNTGGAGTTSFIVKNGANEFIPAGTEVLSWRVSIGAGEFGSGFGPQSFTLDIPANSIELVAFADSENPVPPPPPAPSDVPEPATVALTAAGVALLIARRLRHPV